MKIVTPQIVLTTAIMAELRRIILLRQPSEACGMLLPSPRGQGDVTRVVELPNRASQHHDTYEIHPGDIHLAMGEWLSTATADQVRRVSVWHSHPKGNVGPSPGDVEHKLPNTSYLVLAIVDGELVPCWF